MNRHFSRCSVFILSISIAASLLCFSLAGCSPGKLAKEYLPGQKPDPSPSPAKERVYMDELSGTVQHFDGTSLTILTDDQTSRSFNLARASIETLDGIVSGDQVHIIYEGDLSAAEQDSGKIKPLKVVDSIHGKEPVPEQTFQGSLAHLTEHSITLRTGDQKEVTFPTTGADFCFHGGIRKDIPVYIHYKGEIVTMPDNSGPDAGHLKVLTISDTEPFSPPGSAAAQVPAAPQNAAVSPDAAVPSEVSPDAAAVSDGIVTPTPTVQPDPAGSSQNGGSYARLSDLSDGIMTVITQSGSGLASLDLSSALVYARGGFAGGVLLTVRTSGSLEYPGDSALPVQSVTCEDTAAFTGKTPESTVTGVIVGSTANTVTILTSDSVRLTFNREDARDISTSGMDNGAYIIITFDPASSGESNLLRAVKIEDT